MRLLCSAEHSERGKPMAENTFPILKENIGKRGTL